MSKSNWWARVWKLNDSEGPGQYLVKAGSQFWLEPVTTDGSIAFFYLRFESGHMHECFTNVKLYPVGVTDLVKSTLPEWNGSDKYVRQQFMDEAREVKNEGRDDPLIKRLEGTFWAPPKESKKQLKKPPKKEHEIARFYFLPGVENGLDWFVLDIISPGDVLEQDGIGHGDEE